MLKCGGRYVGTYVYNEWVMNTLNILKSANRIWCVLSRYIHKIRTKKRDIDTDSDSEFRMGRVMTTQDNVGMAFFKIQNGWN
jgi:hypothetical protein